MSRAAPGRVPSPRCRLLWRISALLLLAALGCAACGSTGGGAPAADAGPDADSARPPDGGAPPADASRGDAGPAELPAAPDAGAPELPAVFTLTGLAPTSVSARGGEPLRLFGGGFGGAAPRVHIGPTEAPVESFTATEIAVRTPPLIAGTFDVAVTNGAGATATLAGALDVRPLTLTFRRAPAYGLQAPADVVIRAVAPLDADLDGDLDLACATPQGLLLLENDGAGHFAPHAAAPAPAADLHALAAVDLDGDGRPEWFACTGGRAAPLLFRATAAGLVGEPLPGAPPASECRAAVADDLDGNGLTDVATIELDPAGSPFLRVYAQAASTLALSSEVEPPAPVGDDVGSATSADPAAVLRFSRTADAPAHGHAAAELSYALTELGPVASFALPLAGLTTVPARWRFALRGSGAAVALAVRVVDADGQSFVADLGTVAAPPEWQTFTVGDAPTFVPASGNPEETWDPPLSAVALDVRRADATADAGTLWLDDVAAEFAAAPDRLVEDFERSAPRYPLPAATAALAVGELTGDGLPDVLLRLGEPAGGVEILPSAPAEMAPPAFSAERTALASGVAVAAAAILDVDGDGDGDVLLVLGGGQDRLLLNDGFGRFFDATATALPVDFAAGTALATADLDRDGLPEWLIGNTGMTDRLYLNRGAGRFTDLTPAFGFDDADTRFVVPLDADGDGDSDVLSVTGSGTERLLLRILED